VWKLAKTFSDEVGGLIREPAMQKDFAMCRQLSAASLSIVANIAEGFARGRGKEFVQKEFPQFVRIAAGSNGEASRCCTLRLDGGILEEQSTTGWLR
jgi:four helix bundle protein